MISKDVLSQVETLIVMGMTSPRDVAAINEWVRLNGDDEESAQVRSSLASLPVGTAWVWSPSWLGLLRKVRIRRRHTFDSSSTPKPGQIRTGVSTMAPVDIASLGEQMQQMAREMEASDPAQLRRRIRDLEAAANRPAVPTVVIERVVEYVVPDQAREALTAAAQLLERIEGLTRDAQVLGQLAGTLHKQLTAAVSDVNDHQAVVTAAAQIEPPEIEGEKGEVIELPRSPGMLDGSASPAAGLPKAQRLVLSVLATYGPRPVGSVAILAGYSSKGGGFRNALSAMRTSGLIAGRGDLTITDAGRAALGPVDDLPTGARLRAHWKAHEAVPLAAGKILDVLATHHPEPMSIETLAAATGYEPTGGGFRNAVSRLRSLGLAHGRGALVLDEDLAGN